jgi:hypothetical protein
MKDGRGVDAEEAVLAWSLLHWVEPEPKVVIAEALVKAAVDDAQQQQQQLPVWRCEAFQCANTVAAAAVVEVVVCSDWPWTMLRTVEVVAAAVASPRVAKESVAILVVVVVVIVAGSIVAGVAEALVQCYRKYCWNWEHLLLLESGAMEVVETVVTIVVVAVLRQNGVVVAVELGDDS